VVVAVTEKGDCNTPKAETNLHSSMLEDVVFFNAREFSYHLITMLEKENMQH